MLDGCVSGSAADQTSPCGLAFDVHILGAVCIDLVEINVPIRYRIAYQIAVFIYVVLVDIVAHVDSGPVRIYPCKDVVNGVGSLVVAACFVIDYYAAHRCDDDRDDD